MRFLALSLKSCSQARRYCLDGAQTGTGIYDLPLWHSAVFRNFDNLTDYCPALIWKGVLRICDLFEANNDPKPHLLAKVGRKWQMVGTRSLSQFLSLPATDWSIPSVWVGSWGKFVSLKKMSPIPYVPHRLSAVTWKAFWRSRLPPFLIYFAY